MILLFFFLMIRRPPRSTLFPLHDALPISETSDFTTLAERLNRMTDHLLDAQGQLVRSEKLASVGRLASFSERTSRSEEHTSELQSQSNLVCRLLLEKKKKIQNLNLQS